MDELKQFNSITDDIIGCAIKVHRHFGPGLFERVYEIFLMHELKKLGHQVEHQVRVPVEFEGISIATAYRIDLLVDAAVVVEIKAVESLQQIHHAQLLSYLRLSGYRLGLLINFHEKLLTRGLKRIAL